MRVREAKTRITPTGIAAEHRFVLENAAMGRLMRWSMNPFCGGARRRRRRTGSPTPPSQCACRRNHRSDYRGPPPGPGLLVSDWTRFRLFDAKFAGAAGEVPRFEPALAGPRAVGVVPPYIGALS